MAESPAPSEPLLSAPIPYESTGSLDEPRIEGRRASGAVSWDNTHPVNLRLSIPVFFQRYYFTLAAGKERRSPERLAAERQKHPIKTTGNVICLFAMGSLLGLAGFGAIQWVAVYMMGQPHFPLGM